MDLTMIILRLIHVLSGVFWAGTTFVLVSHVSPAVKATGPEGQKFMQHLAGQGQITNALLITGLLTLLSGWTMYFVQNWQSAYNTAGGVVLGLGAVLGSSAFLHGAFVQRKLTITAAGLGKQVATAGGPPTPDQAAEMGRLAAKIQRNGTVLAYILGITVICMATFQYL